MKENGQGNKERDMEFKYGEMEPNMRDNGNKIEQMVRVSFGMSVEIFMMENGNKIELMVKEDTFMLMELNLKDNGQMISLMVMALKYGQIILDMKEIISLVKKMVLVNIIGVMDLIFWVIGIEIYQKDMEYIHGLMVE